jgi:hypothetical protein
MQRAELWISRLAAGDRPPFGSALVAVFTPPAGLKSDADDADVTVERAGEPCHVVDVGREDDGWLGG